MLDVDPSANGQVDNAPNNRTHNDGKQWAQDLVLEEIGRNNPRFCARTKKWILATTVLVVIVGGVVAGIMLSQGRGSTNETAEPSSSPIEPSSPPVTLPPTRRATRPSLAPVAELSTDNPTLDPTILRTDAPTDPPTGNPSLVPTQLPLVLTASPFVTLDPTKPPVLAPATPRPTSVVDQFISGLPSYSRQLAQSNSSSPQAKALTWIKNNSQFPLYRLNQRYALAVLYYATDGDSWDDKEGWLSEGSECDWSGNYCSAALRLSEVIYSFVDMNGFLPSELEMLTDLETMVFFQVTTSDRELLGVIHSELYVSRSPLVLFSLLLICVVGPCC
jgi:hypothetical protein